MGEFSTDHEVVANHQGGHYQTGHYQHHDVSVHPDNWQPDIIVYIIRLDIIGLWLGINASQIDLSTVKLSFERNSVI